MEPTYNQQPGALPVPTPNNLPMPQPSYDAAPMAPAPTEFAPAPANGASAAQPAPLPAQPTAQTVATPATTPVTTAAAMPTMADDTDLIEKEWVVKAKQIVDKTKQDPYKQSIELNKVRAEYIKKRYNKEMKLPE